MQSLDPLAAGSGRVYVDMVGDLFHAGHVELLRAARRHGAWLMVGVLSDETAASYKRRPIMTLAERVAVIEACRYVDEVVADAPLRLSAGFLEEHAITAVVHGDDLSDETAETVYGAAVAAGILVRVPRTPGLSTTEIIDRVRTRPGDRAPQS
ncbi:MAG: adenylyltransferase/cytidyltransferase family protein [Actinobacteria bacterium]|uniref:ethanolamine-phosphate cytidylyltransferase n=1 Tax=freshwater metagenome TaxID=449393 RepID=A0A6J6NKP3_9ZZZZ|nr:adenylyltransferase/cytidyltransferase family protein [Actinomycetota bacterium]